MSQNIPPENQLYEWSLKKIAIAAGTGLAALIGLGVKKAVNTATVKAYKGRLDRILMDFKERLSENVEKETIPKTSFGLCEERNCSFREKDL
jgi:hypothetical protein